MSSARSDGTDAGLRTKEEVWRDLWLVRFAADGRCVSFEEWPFAPR